MIKNILRGAAIGALALSLAWVYSDPKFDSWVAAAGSAVVLLGLFMPAPKQRRGTQTQELRDGSTGFQAGRDIRNVTNTDKQSD